VATPPAGAPNIILIVIDAGRADALHCCGNERETSPHLDKLAQEGALFEQAYTAAPWTLPSHASLFTGKYPSEHGAHGEYLYLEDRNTTIAEVLHDHGYHTFSVSANGNISPQYNTVQGFERVSTGVYGRRQGRSFLANQFAKLLGKADYGAGDGNVIARRWIADAVNSKRPFFLFMNYMEVHARYGSTPYAARWLPDAKAFRRAMKVPQDTIAYAAGAKHATPEEFALLRALYDGDMLYLDERIGEIIECLRTSGILDNTMLIVTSDHGEELGEHGLVGHSVSLYNTVFRIPLIVRYPKAFPAGSRHKGVVELLDLFPTILDAAGIAEGRSGLKGKSLLDKEAMSKPSYAVTERFLPGAWANEIFERFPRWQGIPMWRRAKAIQDGRFKYLWTSDGQDALYDIQADPLERTNLIGKLPDKARELKAILIARVGGLMRDTGEAEGPPPSQQKN
jgi:arylsulfatase A-like enzyme